MSIVFEVNVLLECIYMIQLYFKVWEIKDHSLIQNVNIRFLEIIFITHK